MDLIALFQGSFIDWEGVEASWAKRTPSSRLLLFAARHYLEALPESLPGQGPRSFSLPLEIANAKASPPDPESDLAGLWGEFIDSALAAELEMATYGERPPVLHHLRAGLTSAAEEAGIETRLGHWFLQRRRSLPGADLPEGHDYLPL